MDSKYVIHDGGGGVDHVMHGRSLVAMCRTGIAGAGVLICCDLSEAEIYDVCQLLNERDGGSYPNRQVVFRKAPEPDKVQQTQQDLKIWVPDEFERKA